MYIFSGGKTGGHIMPLISIIKKMNDKVLFVGQENSLEEELCKKNNIKFVGYKKKKNKYFSILLGYRELCKKMKSYRIKGIVSSGGYVSVPISIYAIRKKIPLYLLEENVILGDSNKLFYPFCNKLFLAYELDKKMKKQIITGLPLRSMVVNNLVESYDVLVIGGSLGSKVLCDAAKDLSEQFKTCLIAGNYYDEYTSNENFNVIKFSNNIYTLMSKAKVIIARAGASTSAEIFFMNKPYICIPSMKTKGNHQYYNAKYFSDKGACLLCLEKDININLVSYVSNLINNEHLRINMFTSQKKLVNRNSIDIIINTIKKENKN